MQTTNFKKLKEEFDRDGYVFIPGFLSENDLHLLNEKLDQYIREVVPTMPANYVFYEDETDKSTLKQMQKLFLYDPYFSQLLTGSKFEQVAENILEEKVVGKEVEYFNKPPRIGKPTPPHQDNYYFNLTPPQAVTMWLALEKVDHENGCLHYVKGSHRGGLRPHARTNTLGFSQGISDFGERDVAQEVAFPAAPGDLLVHHSMTVHRADGNNSATRSRRALGFIYFAESAGIDLKAREAYQKALEK